MCQRAGAAGVVANSAPAGHESQATLRVCPYQKGTTKEQKSKGSPRRVHKVDQSQPMHKQVADLANAIERASRHGERLEAVITRPEFGELTLACGNPGRKNNSEDSRGHGVQHALEARHNISAWSIAETLLLGEVVSSGNKASRLIVERNNFRVVLEREIRQHSRRISKTRAKLHTAMKME